MNQQLLFRLALNKTRNLSNKNKPNRTINQDLKFRETQTGKAKGF